RDALLRIAWDDEWHRNLRKGSVEKAGGFSWRQCALNTYSAYGKVLNLAPENFVEKNMMKKAC
ncbi:hypothetical protein EBX93_06615, partial [bacterium]|nr:hypothetical protein [bacterium]